MTAPSQDLDRERRPGLLILFAPADHPHRDAVCATVAWLAAAKGLLFECYYDSAHTGVHYGGGLPWRFDPADLRGGTFVGGRHLEQFTMVLDRFDCQAACLGATVFARPLADSGIPLRATSADVAEFYRQLFDWAGSAWPETLLVIGNGERRLSLVPYACHEVAQRRVLAISGGDVDVLERLRSGMQVECLWNDEPAAIDLSSVADRSLEMATKWNQNVNTYLLGDPEVAGRWIPTAIRKGWAPVFGIPQADVVARLSKQLENVSLVWGRQQDDNDFLALSKAGVAFQLVDPGRPPFPIISETARPRPAVADSPIEAGDDELRRWAREGRIVGTLVFWAGMVRELECLYALAEILSLTRMKAGLALTTEAFEFFDSTSLALLSVPSELGGLRGQVDTLVASAGAGAMIESAAPPDRFAHTLASSVAALAERLGGKDRLPKGWWGVMDAPLLPRKIGRVKFESKPPSVKLRYRRRSPSADLGPGSGAAGPDLRSRIRESPLGNLFEPIRPFDESRPGGPVLSILEAVGAAGFEFALSKSEFGSPPTLATGVDGLTVINYTAGRWDGWTPFETVNNLADLARAERRLLGSKKPGWLLGGIDACLWTFSGHVLDRGRELRDICQWMAAGGGSGQVVNVTPRTAARYARILAGEGLIRNVPAV